MYPLHYLSCSFSWSNSFLMIDVWVDFLNFQWFTLLFQITLYKFETIIRYQKIRYSEFCQNWLRQVLMIAAVILLCAGKPLSSFNQRHQLLKPCPCPHRTTIQLPNLIRFILFKKNCFVQVPFIFLLGSLNHSEENICWLQCNFDRINFVFFLVIASAWEFCSPGV